MKMKLLFITLLLSCSVLFLGACREEDPTPGPDAEQTASEGETIDQAPFEEPAAEEETPPEAAEGPVAEEPAAEEQAPEDMTAEILTLPPPTIIEPQSGPIYEPGTTVTHQVSQYEWLAQIARCYGAPVDAVLLANPSFNQDIIQPGSKVVVPKVATAGPTSGPPCVTPYIVQPGDTWASIAHADTSAEILQKANPGPLVAGRQIVVPIAPGQQPEVATEPLNLTHDLIFTMDTILARWNHTSGNVEIFDIKSGAEVMDLATNANGNPILAKLACCPAVGDMPSAEMALVDLDANRVALNPQGFGAGSVPSSYGFASAQNMIVSDDGARSAYGYDIIEIVVQDTQTTPANLATFETAAPGTHHFTQAPMRVDPYALYLFPMDENNLLWSDSNGLWQVPYTVDQDSDSFDQLIEMDPFNFFVSAIPSAWTPGSLDGLLLVGLVFEGYSYFVFDPVARQLYQVPGSGAFLFQPAVSWLSGSELAVLSTAETGKPELAVYSLYQNGRTAGQIEGVFEQSSLPLGAPIQGFNFTGPDQRYNIYAPDVQPQQGKVLLAISSNVSPDNGLWSADVATGAMTRLNDFPALAGQALWVPDGSGVLVQSYESVDWSAEPEVLYVPADGSPPVSLTSWLGLGLSDFHWVQ